MSWTEITDYRSSRWDPASDPASKSRHYCNLLEQGQILFFPQPPFSLPVEDRDFLIQQKPSDSRLHKNISYRPTEDRMRGFAGTADEQQRMHRILRRYSGEVVNFVSSFLAPYTGKCIIDFASFRPLEEEGRDLSLHKRNDLLHVDAFPSRPTRGGRILRVFTNLHPVKNRIWITSDRFPILAERFAKKAGLPTIAAGAGVSLRSRLSSLLHSVGLPIADRSPYDQFMLRFHDYLKEDSDFQTNCIKFRSEFPPLATWMVFTDGVPHAALSGQFALEQTLIIPPEALVAPEHAPLRILEKLCGKKLA